jgi:hypothetical protein
LKKPKVPKAYWIGIVVKITAWDEEEASKEAEALANFLEIQGMDVLEARWDNNMPEEDIEA